MSDALQIMWKTPKRVFVRRDNVVVQIRGEEHSVAALEAQDTGLRTFARALFRGPRRHVCGTVRDGARWLAAEIGADADDLVAFVESMRPR